VAASFTTSREVGAELGRQWRELSAEEKAPFWSQTNIKCRLKQIHQTSQMESPNMMTFLPQNRLMFTLQSGRPASMKKHNVLRAFLRFGDFCYLFYMTGFTFGWVEFKSTDAYDKASNLLLPITTLTDVWELIIVKELFNSVQHAMCSGRDARDNLQVSS
jgi:hypothetical protein